MFQLIAQEAQPAGGAIVSFLPLIAIFGVMYFIMIRPQQKRTRQRAHMLNQLEVGDEVLTQGGIMGSVTDIDEEEGIVSVEIAPGTTVRMVRGGVAQRLTEDEEGPYEDEEAGETS